MHAIYSPDLRISVFGMPVVVSLLGSRSATQVLPIYKVENKGAACCNYLIYTYFGFWAASKVPILRESFFMKTLRFEGERYPSRGETCLFSSFLLPQLTSCAKNYYKRPLGPVRACSGQEASLLKDGLVGSVEITLNFFSVHPS